ncbi:MAG: hypothetical protein QXR93_07580 [Archaeoglobaceae archaeon]
MIRINEIQAQQTVQRVFDRVNTYLSFAEMALLDFHRIVITSNATLQKWLKGEVLLSDEEKIVLDYLKTFSTMRYWLLMSYEFLDFLGYSSLEKSDKDLLQLEDPKTAINCSDDYRKVFIKLQVDFERYCREQGVV